MQTLFLPSLSHSCFLTFFYFYSYSYFLISFVDADQNPILWPFVVSPVSDKHSQVCWPNVIPFSRGKATVTLLQFCTRLLPGLGENLPTLNRERKRGGKKERKKEEEGKGEEG